MQAELQAVLAEVRAFLEVASHLGVDGLPLASTERSRPAIGLESRVTRGEAPQVGRSSVVDGAQRTASLSAVQVPHGSDQPRSTPATLSRQNAGFTGRAAADERMIERSVESEAIGAKFGPSRTLLQSLGPLLGRSSEAPGAERIPPPPSPPPVTAAASRSLDHQGRPTSNAPHEGVSGSRQAWTLEKPPAEGGISQGAQTTQNEANFRRRVPQGQPSGPAPEAGNTKTDAPAEWPSGPQASPDRVRAHSPASAERTQQHPLQALASSAEPGRIEEPLAVPSEQENPNQGSLFAAVERKKPTRVKLFDNPFTSPPPADRATALRRFEADVGLCTRCQLCNSRGCLVFGHGNAQAEILLVGDAPGADEEETGQPLAGEAGTLLARICQTMLQRSIDEIYMVNAVLCSPMPGSSPGEAELSACRSNLDRVIELIRPRVIITLGPVAIRALISAMEPLARLRGHWYSYRGIPLMPTFHPRDLLQNSALKRPVKEDMEQVGELLGLSPRRSRG